MFLYGRLSPLALSEMIPGEISLEELLTSKSTMAVEARGWVRKYAGMEINNGSFVPTMWKTDEMDDVVEGIAVLLDKSIIKFLDEEVFFCPHIYKRQ